jgi:hypothetical protein
MRDVIEKYYQIEKSSERGIRVLKSLPIQVDMTERESLSTLEARRGQEPLEVVDEIL